MSGLVTVAALLWSACLPNTLSSASFSHNLGLGSALEGRICAFLTIPTVRESVRNRADRNQQKSLRMGLGVGDSDAFSVKLMED